MELMDTGMFIEEEKLFEYARSSARLIHIKGDCGGRSVAAELRRSFLDIRRFHAVLEKRFGSLSSPPPACEWLLDNWYMIQREYISAYGELCRASHLRTCGSGVVISQLCRAFVNSGSGSVTEERCLLFLDGFQAELVLSRSELHIFPAALRAALICSVAQVCEQMRHEADTSPHAKTLGFLFGSLRLISVLDMEKLINSADVTGAVLAADPSGDYPKMDSGAKQDYLRRVEKLARRAGVEEHEYARSLIKTAKRDGKHVGFYLFETQKKRGVGLYIAANIVASLFISLLLAFRFESIAAALLLLIPVSELVKSFFDFLLLRLIPPVRLPRMDTQKGIPDEGRTICVVSTLLDGSDHAKRLEELYIASLSKGKNMYFGLLSDLPVASVQQQSGDEELFRAARQAIDALNRKHDGGFYLFTRRRSFDGVSWYGKERKRGALIELAKLLCGEENSLEVTGSVSELKDVRYIITLDSDTNMYPGSARELIGAMLHPLNRPHIDEKRRVVTSGHAIIHPRIDTELSSANATDFALIFAGAGGCDPYGSLCGELYMNAFGSGGFAGKGIIDAKALLICTAERFPEGRILSHDSLEGAFLRGAYMGDVEFSDKFPARPLSYYRRLHRWVRGDWQNAPWIFSPALTDIDRWRLLDTLRRSLVTPMTLAAIVSGFYFPVQGLYVAAWAALLALLSRLFLSLAESSLSKRERVRLRRYTRLLTGMGGAIVQTFIRLWLLPFDAWVCLSAAATAVWRMLVSHKNLLQWQTAAQSDGVRGGALEHLRAMWFPALLGLSLLWLSPSIIGRASGLMWLLSPLVCSALALPARRDYSLSDRDKAYLTAAAAKSWRYLKDYSTSSENCLPPDNFQEQPPVGVAHRTSPTNMGLAMAAAVAVSDLGIEKSSEAVKYISGVLDAMERMERCMGHFYNWYDTCTLRPLAPAYISTVDSGNLYAGLQVVRSAAAAWGEMTLAARADKLMAEMNFSPLFDYERGLFYICYDAVGGRGAGGWYDLLASEAMLTSYIAVAKGDVPIKHWRRLSRAQLQQDGYRGLASWTGTMFEYLMPELFLPLYHGSLLYESCKFCMYAQRRRVFAGKPWGVSESAFYSLDASMSYRYKAHGCAALALKRGQDADMVVSPYSSFLALAVEPQRAVQNLHNLEAFGAVGRYGFIEALDFTPGRCRRSTGEKVSCYMAHHVSMSIIAAANAVNDGQIRRRFLAEPAMSACTLILQEKLPADGVVIRRSMAQTPEKTERNLSDRWRLRGGKEDREEKCCVLSNGAYSVFAYNNGATSARCGNTLIYGGQGGMIIRLKTQESDMVLPFTVPDFWELSEDVCRWRCVSGGIDCSVSVLTAGGDCGELRTAELTGSGQVELTLSFVPVLADAADYRSHSAFWSLGLHAEIDGSALILRRLRRGSNDEQWLCLKCDAPADYSADRSGMLGYLTQPCVSASVKLSLDENHSSVVHFALCFAKSKADVLSAAERILALGSPCCSSMVCAAAIRLGMSEAEIGGAMELLLPLLKNRLHEASPKRELWQYAISGDFPLICCDGSAQESVSVLKSFCFLRSCGVAAELVYLTDEQGEYQRPLYRRISSELARVELEALIGQREGVHFAPNSAEKIVRSRAAVTIGQKQKKRPGLPLPALSGPRRLGAVPEYCWEKSAFIFELKNELPQRIWQNMLTNGSFGFIAADSGCGNMFYKNSREMPVNLPPERIVDLSGTEALWLNFEQKDISLFAANDGVPCKVSYAPGLASWEKEYGGHIIRTTAFIPVDTDARIVLIEGAAGLEINWRLETVFGSGDGASVCCRTDGDIFACENAEAFFPDAVFLAAASVKVDIKCDFQQAGMLMRLRADGAVVLACGCCGKEALMRLCDVETAKAEQEKVVQYWEKLIGKIKIRTGTAALDHYLNNWCAYQCIAGRLMGRSSLYQSGGAFGFRDQLQDSINMLMLSPKYARVRILDCCRHQYLEGDVMHWWHAHPEGDKGVRTRCSDDLLWLVWALCEYVDATGDTELCQVQTHYISSPALEDAERDRYETPEQAPRFGSVFEHAAAALECAVKRGAGPRGLPLFGSGDWNDALDNIDGESAWLGFFMADCLTRFAALLDKLGKPEGERYRALGEKIGRTANDAWNGQWFLRGYNADGSAVGGEARLDSLPQSWSVLSAQGQPERAEMAVKNAADKLFDRKNKVVRLFSPPYSPDEPYVGYISSYGEGIRENGGQYTHGAIWLAMAALRTGHYSEGWEMLLALLPEGHDMARYGAEPYVLAADVCTSPEHMGEAGWTWYTGSAGWFFRAAVNELLGISLKDGKLTVRPEALPVLKDFTVEYTGEGGEKYLIECRDGTTTVKSEKSGEEML